LTQAGDAREQDNTAPAVLLREEASDQAAQAFVGAVDQAVEQTVLPGRGRVRMLLASGAPARG
jgi:hypothetical protein